MRGRTKIKFDICSQTFVEKRSIELRVLFKSVGRNQKAYFNFYHYSTKMKAKNLNKDFDSYNTKDDLCCLLYYVYFLQGLIQMNVVSNFLF